MRVVVQIQSPFLLSPTSLQPITAASPSLPVPSISSEKKSFPVTVFALRVFWIFFLGITEFVMLAVSSLGNTRDENKGEMVGNFSMGVDDFPDFGNGNILDGIDFDDLFVGIDDGDVLPDLDMDAEILTEFSLSAGEDSDVNASVSAEKYDFSDSNKDDEGKASGSISGLNSSSSAGEEIVSKREDGVALSESSKEVVKSKKSSLPSKNNSQGKRKVKVDWTPELHRRFVQAVEQLGVDKAVPSRILELMGIECLTRHNIASHLQKYRSHRKHLLAREAEAARWGQRRQMYGPGGGGGKKEMVSSWLVPTIGFPPMTPPLHNHHFRPLHVWGHPFVDQSSMQMWPKHLSPYFSPAPPPPWPPSAPLPTDATPFWHPHHQRVQNGVTSGAPCFPPPMGATRFLSPPVPGIPSHPLYKVDHHANSLTASRHSPPHQPSFDFHPSKESVDAAIGDVLSKPWLPLPLGLKPPSLDGVMVELQRQGISKIPPSSCSA